MKSLLTNVRYIFQVRGRCSWLECTKLSTRFERWDDGEFSISCREHHALPYCNDMAASSWN
jgi:hypothetical protein